MERLEVEDRAGAVEGGALEASPWHLVLIEEDPDRRATLRADLEKDGDYRVVAVSTPPEALGLLDQVPFDVMVADLTTPGRGLGASKGERLASIVRTGAAMPGVLVMVVLGTEDTALAGRAETGGLHVARTTRGADLALLEKDLRLGLERLRMQKVLEDSNAQLEREVRSDPLTTALNRRGLLQALQSELERSRRSHREMVALLVDLDDFKQINDRYGLSAGDRVLVEVVERMRGALRRTDHLSRVGGDEFVVLLPETRPGEARMLAEKIRSVIASEPFHLTETRIPIEVTASIGVVGVSEPSIESILRRGHPVLRLSKHTGKDRVSVGSEGSDGRSSGSLPELLRALERPGILTARSAPIVRVRDERVVGHELFVRSSLAGFESPLDLFRAATDAESVRRIDLLCFRTCCLARSRVEGGREIHFNLNPETLSEDVVPELLEMLDEDDDDREIVIDLSETQIVGDAGYLERPLAALRSAGVSIALDDGSWGSACLETLILVRPEILKLRPRLLRDARQDAERGHRLRRMVALGRRLGSTVLCEGVEDRSELELLRELGVDLVEGPYWPLREL